MLTILLIVVIVIFLGVVYYKQTVQEYKLNQIEWSQVDRMPELMEEGTPFIIRSIPHCPVWNHADIMARPTFKDLADWMKVAPANAMMPWHEKMARMYGEQAALDPWLEETWSPQLGGVWKWLPLLFKREVQTWVGRRGLYLQRAMWTLIFPTDGEIVVTLMSAKEDRYMPAAWEGRFAHEFTAADTPYVSKLKYLDVKLRPGVALFVPAHWRMSWDVAEETDRLPCVCLYNLHTPISRMATALVAR
jgi:hypothetical protein